MVRVAVHTMRFGQKILFECSSRTEGELLIFARPKKSSQKKGRPETCPAGTQNFSIRRGVFRQALPGLSENARHPCRAPAGLISPDLRCSAASTGSVDYESAAFLHASCRYGTFPSTSARCARACGVVLFFRW